MQITYRLQIIKINIQKLQQYHKILIIFLSLFYLNNKSSLNNESINEIHSKIKQMRYFKECTLKQNELATFSNILEITKNLKTKFPVCGADARPHTLFVYNPLLMKIVKLQN
ncbi:unnamed protein product [Paramecium sonneborni]|uniref:Uncharacterized protein n=1 Tax=Paramecium sonneborni TaxID=65129 RepID=A0A8S1RQT3_9CILI|nr:unnamed protein product [Paramecium sonneborni]